MAEEKVYSKGTGMTVEDVKAQIEARVQAALEQALARPREEVAEPFLWWNLFSGGPFQMFAPGGPLPPHQVIKVGETAYIGTVLVLNPFPILPPPPGITPCSVLSNFALPYEVRYQTCNLSTCSLGAPNAVHKDNLDPGQCFYVDVLEFTAQEVGLFQMNIVARILGSVAPGTAPQFAGFARWVYDFDPELFLPGPTPGLQYDFPLKFMVYS
jgi:hypothetical protein